MREKLTEQENEISRTLLQKIGIDTLTVIIIE